jgi:hypothetical protein
MWKIFFNIKKITGALFRRVYKMSKFPFIIVLDIDNTIIGTVNQLSKEREVLEFIYNLCKKNKHDKCVNVNSIDMQKELKDGLLRPYINEFLHFCNKKFKNVEVFFYTNSTYNYTHSFLATNVAKSINFKINKPYFTRENSMIINGSTKKSLVNILPFIVKKLVKKYPIMKSEKMVDYIIHNRFIFIDDIPSNTFEYENRQLVCPKYEYRYYHDIPEVLIKKYNVNPELFNNRLVLEYLYNTSIPIYNKHGNIHQRNKEFIELSKEQQRKYSEVSKVNDVYFKDLIKELSKKSISDIFLSDKNINIINKKLKNVKYF